MMPDRLAVRRLTLRIWGCFDALHIAYYVIGSSRLGHLPFITDVEKMFRLAAARDAVTSVFVAMNLILQVSILGSALMLLLGRKAGVYLGVVQIPFRLLFLTPSISILLIWTSLSDYNVWLMLGLIVGSEVIKGITLWWVLPCHKVPVDRAGS